MLQGGKLDDKTVLEEVLPLLSEALTKGMIKLPETTLGKLSDIFRRAFAAVGWNFAITEGKDVINLIRDFNLAMESPGGLSRGLKNIGEGKGSFGVGDTNINLDSEGTISSKYQKQGKEQMVKEDIITGAMVELGLIPETSVSNEANVEGEDKKASKRLTDLVVDFQEGKIDYKELKDQYIKVGKSELKRWVGRQPDMTIDFKNFQTNKQIEELLEAQFPSFERNFDASKSQATTYMGNISKRVGIEIAKEGARQSKQISTDVLQEKGFSPETTTQPELDDKLKPTGKRKKVFPNKIKTISKNITGETRADQMVMLKNDIIEGILRVGPKPKEIAKYIVEKTKTKEYRKLIKDKLGVFGSEQYINNVRDLFENQDFISSIPVANIKRRFGKLFGISKINTVPTVKVEEGKETRYDKGIYNIPEITDGKLARIRNYFLDVANGEKRSQSLFSMIGEGLAVEVMEELSTDTDFMKELQNRLNFRKSSIDANQFMSELNFDLDKRNLEDTSLDNVKASKKFDLSQVFLNDFAKIVLDKNINEVLSNLNITNKKLNTESLLRKGQKEVLEFIQVTGMPMFMFESFALKQAGAIRVNPKNTSERYKEAKEKGKDLNKEAFQRLNRFNRWRKGKNIDENTDEYYYELNNGDWVKGDKVKNSWVPPEAHWKNIKPGRGRLYWGENDPAYEDALAATAEGGIEIKRVSRTTKELVADQDFMEGKVQGW